MSSGAGLRRDAARGAVTRDPVDRSADRGDRGGTVLRIHHDLAALLAAQRLLPAD